MTEALPPELYKCVDLSLLRHRLDTLPALSVVLVDEHLDEAADVWDSTQG